MCSSDLIGVDYWDVNRTGTVTNNYQDTVNRFFGRAPGAAAGSAPGGLLPEQPFLLPAGRAPPSAIEHESSLAQVLAQADLARIRGWQGLLDDGLAMPCFRPCLSGGP